MKTGKFLFGVITLCILLFTGCMNDNETADFYENKIFVSSAPVYSDLLISPESNEAERTISVGLAQPLDRDVTVTFEPRPMLAARYNMMYRDNAEALLPEFYSIPEPSSLIRQGSVKGVDVSVRFVNTSKLDPKRRYVLPVTIVNADDVPVVENSRTVYFVFKGAALINMVADVSNLKFAIGWSSTARAMMTDMRKITVEALLYSRDWVARRDDALSTVFGIEGTFLIRIGDSDRPRNQLQLVHKTGTGNWPGPNEAPGLPVDKWVHIAVVVDLDTKERIYYIDGKVVARDKGAGTAPFTITSGVYIGYAWENSRWIPGRISEMRIWNVQRTAEQIAENPYYINPAAETGLVAYWKFNEGTGNVIKDYSGNGTNLTSTASDGKPGSPVWVPVELPED